MSIHHMVESSTATAHSTVNTVRKMLRLDQPDEVVPLDNLHARRLRSSMDAGEMLNPSARSPAYDADPSDQAAHQFARERRLQRMRSDLVLLPRAALWDQQKLSSRTLTTIAHPASSIHRFAFHR